ncbi:PhoH family protein [Rubellicoccus peritrichatus]|uniref:PhoH-like protein n=1 Tax=Rubellicoccus peritrichatus TaxID=3080537 RepID=A0AAQ3L7E4_9BACT|nr:PhoH family protein [Puniceicoccus sp. CR14]WOO40361.1 PhoH family protein [Puniceicoccus sp. CR14]
MPSKTLQFPSPRHLNQLYCGREENLVRAESILGVSLLAREDWLQIDGNTPDIDSAEEFFNILDRARGQGIQVGSSDFVHILDAVKRGEGEQVREVFENPMVIKLRKTSIVPKTVNQKRYLSFIGKHDVVFGIGPAGTGKTYLAVASALQALQEREVQKIIITRPAVEAGEALGFLPGDLQEKILPYLRPLYDAMYDMVGQEDTARMIERGLIEIAPLAYMRGRTLSNAYVILDEAQNTSPEQMMMFLTRLGDGSRMVITGDITQVDLPRHKKSGLKQAVQILSQVSGIKLFYFEHTDVVRHPLVSRIIAAYEAHASERENGTH